MATNFRAISEQAKRAAAERQMTSGDAASYAAGYEIGLLQQIICDLESRLARQQSDTPSESRDGMYDDTGSQADMLSMAISESLEDGEICYDAIRLAIVDNGALSFDGCFMLEDGSVWSASLHLTARKHKDADPQDCAYCRGSGEGMTERSYCYRCDGRGVVDVE